MVERVLVEVPVLLDWFVVDLHFDRTPELMKIVIPRSGIELHQGRFPWRSECRNVSNS